MKYLKNLWKALRGKTGERGYRQTVGTGSAYNDWMYSYLSEDADLKNNNALVRDRSRDLFKTDCYFRKYKEELFANVFGEEGIRLRMKVKEEIDRVVYAADEKAIHEAKLNHQEKLGSFVARKTGIQRTGLFRHGYDRAKATIKAGAMDLYACRIIEERYKEWQRAEFCTMSGKLTYNQVRQIRLLSCARDGDFFLRMVRGKKVNKFGFSLQLINSEWCDFNLNESKTARGTTIRMGVEMDEWGKPVAYHFIKRTAWDWQMSTPNVTGGAAQAHEVVPASDIIHYARLEYADSTRGAPWTAAVIAKSRQLDKFEEAEVIAARTAACKMGVVESDLVAEGGSFDSPDPCNNPQQWDAQPGSIQGMPWGMKMKPIDWQHPTQNFDQFRRGMLRSWCAGLPGADYNVIANDLENINFSAGRLGRLDTNEMWKLLQRFDIDVAERPIFEAWLEMAMMSGAIPLPLAKFEKFNKPLFSGRRWAGVDPIKETQAAVLAIQNKLMSYSQWYDDNGRDLEESWGEISEEEMLAEELGIELPQPEGAQPETTDEEDPEEKDPEEKPAKNGSKSRILNGAGVH